MTERTNDRLPRWRQGVRGDISQSVLPFDLDVVLDAYEDALTAAEQARDRLVANVTSGFGADGQCRACAGAGQHDSDMPCHECEGGRMPALVAAEQARDDAKARANTFRLAMMEARNERDSLMRDLRVADSKVYAAEQARDEAVRERDEAIRLRESDAVSLAWTWGEVRKIAEALGMAEPGKATVSTVCERARFLLIDRNEWHTQHENLLAMHTAAWVTVVERTKERDEAMAGRDAHLARALDVERQAVGAHAAGRREGLREAAGVCDDEAKLWDDSEFAYQDRDKVKACRGGAINCASRIRALMEGE